MAIRPEDIKITSKPPTKSQNSLNGIVSEALFSGNVMKISVRIGGGDIVKVECPPKANSFVFGDKVHVNWMPEDCNILLS